MTTTHEYDERPNNYNFDNTDREIWYRSGRVIEALEPIDVYTTLSWGQYQVPSVGVTSYDDAAKVRKALAMEDVVKHNTEHAIVYTGLFSGLFPVEVVISRRNVCTIEYVTEVVTKEVPDPDFKAPTIFVTEEVTTTVYNCNDDQEV